MSMRSLPSNVAAALSAGFMLLSPPRCARAQEATGYAPMDSTTVAVGMAFFNAAGALIPGDRQEKGHREQGIARSQETGWCRSGLPQRRLRKQRKKPGSHSRLFWITADFGRGERI